MIWNCQHPHERPDREWDGQRFVHNLAEGAEWERFPIARASCAATQQLQPTRKMWRGYRSIRRGEGVHRNGARHDADIHFTFVMKGTMVLEGEGTGAASRLEAGDAFVIPPEMKTRYAEPSDGHRIARSHAAGGVQDESDQRHELGKNGLKPLPLRCAKTPMRRIRNFKVGAAVLSEGGVTIYAGCNVENIAYPEGTCAEAGAIAAMVAAGRDKADRGLCGGGQLSSQ